MELSEIKEIEEQEIQLRRAWWIWNGKLTELSSYLTFAWKTNRPNTEPHINETRYSQRNAQGLQNSDHAVKLGGADQIWIKILFLHRKCFFQNRF